MLRHYHLLLCNMKLFHMPTNSILLSYCWIMLLLHPFLPGGPIWWEPWSGLLCYVWAIMRGEIAFIFDKDRRSRPLCSHSKFPKHLSALWIFHFFSREFPLKIKPDMEILGPTRKDFRRGKQEFMMKIPLASLPNMLSYRHKIKRSLLYKHLLSFRKKTKWNLNTSEVLLKHFLPKVDQISAFKCVSFSDNPSVSWLARYLELTGLWITLQTEGVWMLICGPLTPHIS